MNEWQRELQQNLGTGAERVVEAIAYLADDLCGSDAVAWLDIRQSPKLVVYVVSRGVVHVITGNRPERQDPDAPMFPAACEYRATAVRRDWNWSLKVRQDERPNVGPTVYRKWTFDLPGLADAPLEMEFPPPPTPQLSSAPDPAPFAKALVVEIVEAQRRFDG